MFFHAQFDAPRASFDLDSMDTIVLTIKAPHPHRIEITQSSKEDNVNLFFEMEVSPDIAAQFDLQEKQRAEKLEQTLKPEMGKLIEELSNRSREWAGRALQTLRWQCALPYGPNIEAHLCRVFWSHDGKTWIKCPPETPGRISIRRVYGNSMSTMVSETEAVLNENRQSPLAYGMISEAYSLCGDAPRSALVIGIAALEIAVKDFISTRVPKARWLATKAPTPPVDRMLRDYLPTLSKDYPCPPKRVYKLLKEGIELRNEIAHDSDDTGSRSPVDTNTVYEVLDAVRDTFWILEMCKGVSRVWQGITENTKQEYIVEFLSRQIQTAKVLNPNELNTIEKLMTARFSPAKPQPIKFDQAKAVWDKLPAPIVEEMKKHSLTLEFLKEKGHLK